MQKIFVRIYCNVFYGKKSLSMYLQVEKILNYETTTFLQTPYIYIMCLTESIILQRKSLKWKILTFINKALNLLNLILYNLYFNTLCSDTSFSLFYFISQPAKNLIQKPFNFCILFTWTKHICRSEFVYRLAFHKSLFVQF